jgi:hypothetical protein
MHEDAPTLTDESRIFIEKLAPSFIWILAIGIRGTPNLSGMAGPARRDVLAAHRIELSDIRSSDSVFSFNYGQDGQQILPFFSSEDCARQFLATKKWGARSFFQPYRLLAGFVTAPGNEKFNPILDPGLPSERKLQSGEKALLRKITSATKQSPDAPAS